MQIKEQLIAAYPYRTEMHAHALPISRCSEFSPKELVEIYAKTGVDSLVLTNHFTPEHVAQASEEALVASYIACFREVEAEAKKHGITAIFSMELRFQENSNDYLLYGITEEELPKIYRCVAEGMGIREFSRTYDRGHFLLMQAHPLRNGIAYVEGEFLDGIEAFNMHPGHNSRVGLSAKRAREEGLLLCGGTDFHHMGHQGVCLMRTKKRMETPSDLVEVLRAQDFLLDIGGCILLP